MDKSKKLLSWKINRYLVAILLIAVAAAMRIWPLAALETRLAWLTFYPAVMFVSLYGGLTVGLLSTALACLTNLYLWPYLVTQPFIKDSADWLGLAVFVMNAVMIAGVAEAMRRANARAKQAQANAEAANKAKSVFLASMSHELRTPLNAILGFSNILRQAIETPDPHQKPLDIINRSAEHLLTLINDVLDMAKIDAGRLTIDPSPFNLMAMLDDVVDLLRVRATDKNLQLNLVIAPDCPRFVVADNRKLRQMLINLIGNAIKFTEQGSVTLRVSVLPNESSQQRPCLMIAIEDTGVGIAEADQNAIFEPFVQLANQTTFQKGTGLGLTITRQFVQLMGGAISVKSKIGVGTTLGLQIPFEPLESEVVDSELKPHGKIIKLTANQSEHRLLIVEDQMENWLLLQQLLESVGFQVRVATNGLEGIKTFKVWQPDLIWMDVRMPVMDGLEATRQIRKLTNGRQVKIIALTASVFKEERDQVLAAGVDDFIRKPYRPNEIYDCLTHHLGTKFDYADLNVSEPLAQSGVLSQAAMASLPATLRDALLQALMKLDSTQINAVIARITEHDALVGADLAHHAQQFNYTLILQALKTNPPSAVTEQNRI